MNQNVSKQTADELDAALDATVTDHEYSLSMTPKEAQTELHRQHHERIQDLRVEALGSPDNLDACMGEVLCDLLEWCASAKQALDEASSSGPSALARFKDTMPVLDMHLRLARQSERYANVACRIRESGATSAPRGTSHGRQRAEKN